MMVSVACSDDIKQKIRFGNSYDWENVTQRRLISTPHRFSEHKPFINGNFQNRCNDDELQVLPWKFWDVRSVNQGGKVEDTAHTSPEIFRPHDHRDEIWNYVVRCSLQQDAVFSHCSYFNHCHEHLFYKIVTPSDVGKLNRLVIPKHHAEQCFPLELTQRKRGLLLTFRDDATGKLWWFRYSYWSSSQSYVLTKGWIRFVKEKRLQAGDIISFAKGSREEFYITSCKQKPFRSPTVRQGLQTKPVDQSFTDLVKHAHLGAYYDSCQKGSDQLQLLLPSEEPSSSSKAVAAELSDHRAPVVQKEDMHVLDCRTADPLNSFSNLRLFGVDLCSSFASSN